MGSTGVWLGKECCGKRPLIRAKTRIPETALVPENAEKRAGGEEYRAHTTQVDRICFVWVVSEDNEGKYQRVKPVTSSVAHEQSMLEPCSCATLSQTTSNFFLCACFGSTPGIDSSSITA